jgi:hypothetical protein
MLIITKDQERRLRKLGQSSQGESAISCLISQLQSVLRPRRQSKRKARSVKKDAEKLEQVNQ